jgi:2-methylaconitate cis-trans-isomerase PrpF
MERVHLAVPLTVAMCLSAAMMVEGTLPNVFGNTPKRPIRIGNPSGILPVDASVERKNEDWEVTRTTVYRTARRLMEGKVLLPDKP